MLGWRRQLEWKWRKIEKSLRISRLVKELGFKNYFQSVPQGPQRKIEEKWSKDELKLVINFADNWAEEIQIINIWPQLDWQRAANLANKSKQPIHWRVQIDWTWQAWLGVPSTTIEYSGHELDRTIEFIGCSRWWVSAPGSGTVAKKKRRGRQAWFLCAKRTASGSVQAEWLHCSRRRR